MKFSQGLLRNFSVAVVQKLIPSQLRKAAPGIDPTRNESQADDNYENGNGCGNTFKSIRGKREDGDDGKGGGEVVDGNGSEGVDFLPLQVWRFTGVI